MSVGSGGCRGKGRADRCQLALGVLDEVELDEEESDDDVEEAVDVPLSDDDVDDDVEDEPDDDEEDPRLSFL